MTGPADWDAEQYLRFEDERTRPALAGPPHGPEEMPPAGKRPPPRAAALHRPRLRARQQYRVDCRALSAGPAGRTRLLAGHARDRAEAPPRTPSSSVTFTLGDVATWSARDRYDLVFANAVLQWVPDHPHLMQRLVRALTSDGDGRSKRLASRGRARNADAQQPGGAESRRDGGGCRGRCVGLAAGQCEEGQGDDRHLRRLPPLAGVE